MVLITGFEEAMEVYNDPAMFSSCNTVAGPFAKFPVPLEGDDISATIEQYRDDLPFSDQLPSFDPPKHTAHRGLLLRLITPKRLKENEEFMWQLADRQIDGFLGHGECEFVSDYAKPFTLLVIADLLGVPQADHDTFRSELQGDHRPTRQSGGGPMAHKPLEFLYDRFTDYIEELRREPRARRHVRPDHRDLPRRVHPRCPRRGPHRRELVLGGRGDDRTTPGVRNCNCSEKISISRACCAPSGTASRTSSRRWCDSRARSRASSASHASPPRSAVSTSRPARRSWCTTAPRTAIPRHFEAPAELRLDRTDGRHHLGFGFGIHTCVGAPLARAEARVSLERIFDRTAEITISEREHGPADARRYEYSPIYMLRGLEALHLEFTAAAVAGEKVAPQ